MNDSSDISLQTPEEIAFYATFDWEHCPEVELVTPPAWPEEACKDPA